MDGKRSTGRVYYTFTGLELQAFARASSARAFQSQS